MTALPLKQATTVALLQLLLLVYVILVSIARLVALGHLNYPVCPAHIELNMVALQAATVVLALPAAIALLLVLLLCFVHVAIIALQAALNLKDAIPAPMAMWLA
tara:strand:+ start:312 stop:623 length:312 start_codon:yes stop_codon:yes gene_type:complete